jgi:hypothetical protein
MSTSTDQFAVLNPPVERRFYPRVIPSSPIYVAFGPNNLGTLLNVSENGLLVAAPNGLDVNSVYRVFLTLDGSPSAITVSVRTIWTDKSQNSSGIQLLDLSEQNREQIREWVAAQSYRNEHFDQWFSPKEQEPLPAISSPDLRSPEPGAPETAEPQQEVLQSTTAESTTTESKPAESQSKPSFPPMPLPIHGEFTYEPPPGRLKEVVPVRRRRSAVHSKSRSSALRTILWTVFVATVCLAGARSYRTNAWSLRDRVSDLFLHRPVTVATESAPQTDQSPSSAASDGPTAPAEAPSSSTLDQGANIGTGSNAISAPMNGTPKTLPPPSAPDKQFEPTAHATKPNLGTVSKRSTEFEGSPTPRPYDAYSRAVDSAPRPTPTRNPAAPAPTAEDLPAPGITTPAIAVPAQAPTSPSTANPPAPPAPNQSSTKALATYDSTARAASADALSRKSAIVGSISNSGRPGNLSVGTASDMAPTSPAPTSAVSPAPRGSSYVAPKPNPGNPAVIQMDVPEARVIEVKPPRNLTGSFTASLVDLPGERVIRSASLTMHIQRSVRFPRERIPGERWLWRGHEKVALGELASRVDPQVPQPALSSGSITLEASIDKDGYVTDVKPLYGSFALLPNAARAIREWRYEPTYLNDKAVETQAKIEIDFHSANAARANKPQ